MLFKSRLSILEAKRLNVFIRDNIDSLHNSILYSTFNKFLNIERNEKIKQVKDKLRSLFISIAGKDEVHRQAVSKLCAELDEIIKGYME